MLVVRRQTRDPGSLVVDRGNGTSDDNASKAIADEGDPAQHDLSIMASILNRIVTTDGRHDDLLTAIGVHSMLSVHPQGRKQLLLHLSRLITVITPKTVNTQASSKVPQVLEGSNCEKH